MQRNFLMRHAREVIGIVALVALAGVLAISAWVQFGPKLSLDAQPDTRPSLILLDAQGQPFARRGAYREAPVDAAQLPPLVVAAFLAIEDRRFNEHGGLDLRGIVRAAAANFLTGEAGQGGSTITQQLAKIAFVGNDRSFGRKLREAIVALRLEHQYTKTQILSAYLNRAYFGDGTYGLGAAAMHYFGRAPQDLDLAQAAMLAGVVNAPSRLAPSRHLADAQARAELVLAAMAETGQLTRQEADRVVAAEPRATLPFLSGGYFADWVASQALAGATTGYGHRVVKTTLDSSLQRSAEAVVSKAIGQARNLGKDGQVALVAMRTDGSVVAMVGGRDYRTSQFNRAVQAERQPGSAFKLFVYLAALRNGADSETLVSDRPLTVAGWTPKNYSNRYAGPIPLTRAFAQSSNVAAVRLSEQVGREAVIQAAHDLGLRANIKPLPSIALGTSPTTLLELTGAYASVAAGSYPVRPIGMPADDAFQARTEMGYEERAALLGMLNAVVEDGTGTAARLPLPAFGKTGTTQDHRDAWFVGFSEDLVVGVWVGNDNEAPMKTVTGGGIPAKIWHDFMTVALSDQIVAAEARKAQAELRDTWPEEGAPWQDREPEWWDLRRVLPPWEIWSL